MIKKINYLLILTVAFLGGCQENEDPRSEEIQKIKTEMASGPWVISKFIDSGKDETSDFLGFVFVFNPSGALSAKRGSLEFTGTWSVTNSSGKNNSQGNDNSQDDLDFNIFFNLSNEFEDLNDDWAILTHTSTEIELTDVSGGDGSVDFLTFRKN